ncbi:hypothetical protein [Streptomyces sp. SID2888]|uniref:hypothetical protein n=1 Tax=Streptomyces sp. SID2888 TaxID=2690256 RepID=UPI001368AA2C|nr:hypothetical protein [Streptomyces sp. SID2888]MYV45586.1 hypothetical protein [Streptomyces sp. SID2888]
MPVLTHLAAVWFIGSALTALQFYAVILAGFSGNTAALVITLAVMVPLAVYAFVCLGAAARSIVPLTRRARGLWAWASGVYGLGTAGLGGPPHPVGTQAGVRRGTGHPGEPADAPLRFWLDASSRG